MTKWLPYPLLAVGLLVAWLLLNESVGVGTVLLGALAAVGLTWVVLPLSLPSLRMRRLTVAMRLALVVLAEIIRSNNAVARIILSPWTTTGRRSGFVRIPLDLRNPYGLAALACIITATPGTVWVEYDSGDHSMLLHVLDLIDEEQWVRIVKDRYERRLMEIVG